MCDDLKSLKKAVPERIIKQIMNLTTDEEEHLIMLEEFIERAGIMEFDGMQSRFMAYKNALKCVIRNFESRNNLK